MMPEQIGDDVDRTGRRISTPAVSRLGRELAGVSLLVVVSVVAVLFARRPVLEPKLRDEDADRGNRPSARHLHPR